MDENSWLAQIDFPDNSFVSLKCGVSDNYGNKTKETVIAGFYGKEAGGPLQPPVEYYRSRKPKGEISKQNVVQAIQDYFKDKKIPEVGRQLKKRDVVNVIKAYFS